MAASIGFNAQNQLTINGSTRTFGSFTAYNLISGGLELGAPVITTGMATTLYTGNGTTQSVVTGVDMATQWGNDVSETFGGLVIPKGRSFISDFQWIDTVRGATKNIRTNGTDAEYTDVNGLTAFTSTGFNIGSSAGMNQNTSTYASWNFQTTHRITGTTNHGKPYTCHYNPFTGFTMVKYEGSGLAGHEIPHHLGRKLGFYVHKNLSAIADWLAYDSDASKQLLLNTTAAAAASSITSIVNTETAISLHSNNVAHNTSTNQYIMYGWANSYFDEANTLIGNYEIGTYQGTGAAGNKVTTRGKPSWVMIKRLDSTGNWWIFDNQRLDKWLEANLSDAEISTDQTDLLADGFIIKVDGTAWPTGNASGGQYLYMVVYDNDSGSGKSKYNKATDTSAITINATLPLAKGLDLSGSKVSVVAKNETITGLTYTEGDNYVYYYE